MSAAAAVLDMLAAKGTVIVSSHKLVPAALLAQRGLGAQIEANAAAVFDWLGAYLAQPRGGKPDIQDRNKM